MKLFVFEGTPEEISRATSIDLWNKLESLTEC